MQTPLTFFFAFVAVLVLIGAVAWLVRRFAGNRLGGNANRGRMPRLAVVRIIASCPIAPLAGVPFESNFGSIRSRGLKFGVSELEMFSASTRWRSWCQAILVRSADRIGRSLIAIGQAQAPLPQSGTPEVGRICRLYG